MVFVKGYDPQEPKQQTYHIHAAPEDHILWNRIHFRNYLITHPEVARTYEELKRSLADEYKHDRVGYRMAKTEFIKEYTDKSLMNVWFTGKLVTINEPLIDQRINWVMVKGFIMTKEYVLLESNYAWSRCLIPKHLFTPEDREIFIKSLQKNVKKRFNDIKKIITKSEPD